ncbi:MAG: hypothetical protein RL235_633, partial [Chlamydiota bacterium]
FIEFPFAIEAVPKRIFQTVTPEHFWHSAARLIGSHFLADAIETVLFLDADEICDAARFNEWLGCSDYQMHTTLKLANYWYFREPAFQANAYEDSILLAQRRALEPKLLLCKEERDAIYSSLPGPKRRMVFGVDGRPMFHHYSWVRTQDEMLKKVRAWGHRKDKDWETEVMREFARPFSGTDFVHGYTYNTVEPLIDLSRTFPIHALKQPIDLHKVSTKQFTGWIKEASPRSGWTSLFSR